MKKSLLAGLVVSMFLMTVSPVLATTWDLTTDFSTTSNPSGAWTYGYEQTFNGSLIQYSNPAWNDLTNNAYGTPAVWKNLGTTTAYGVAPGEVSLHPGSHNEFSVARWTSTVSGQVTLNGYFGSGDIYPMSYYISENSNLTLFSDWSDSSSKPYSLTTAVAIGDTIDFMVGVGTGSFWYGNTPVGATITYDGATPVPEPSTFLLFGAGLGGFALWRRKRS